MHDDILMRLLSLELDGLSQITAPEPDYEGHK